MVKKTVYIAPAINVVRVNTESMIAESGPQLSGSAASSSYDMEVKDDRGGFFDDEW